VSQLGRYFSERFLFDFLQGRQLSSPKLPGTIQVALLNSKTLSLGPDILAVRDSKNEKSVFLFDTQTGKQLMNGSPISHKVCRESNLTGYLKNFS